MQILSVHNCYQIRGGEDVSWAAEVELLRAQGHRVEIYEETNDRTGSFNALQLAQRTVWSRESYDIVTQKLQATGCDLMHVQNFFPLISPSIYYAAQAQGVPVVQTLRNYRLLCPNGLFFRDGQVCEDCLGNSIPYPGIVHSCYRGSRAATTATAAMLVTHQSLKTWHNQVDLYIALTQFARKKFIQGGLPPEKIVVKPNFVYPDPGVGSGEGGFALYVGRLSVEKGLDTLLTAWEQLETQVPLKIVGDGPLAEKVQAIAGQRPNVEWLGRQPMAQVHALMGQAQFLVFPSKWYETFGRVAVEAFAKGTPVVASDIGAIAELVEDEHTGIRFSPGDATDLAAKVEWMLAEPQRLARMRQAARAEFEAHYTAASNYQQLMQIYDQVRR
ncbi:glycosyltransferase family 4 protein [Sphaerothrix gracilis]|uniref:glycosyltransferase family 4 protein n=1 Tax=Sphaerothrix gracilis TaxID=3151835 RepID=UPI0031FD3D27